MVACWPEALISESHMRHKMQRWPNLDYKKPFHFLIRWKQWTGTIVNCNALPALELMTGKNLKSSDCCLNFLPRPGHFQRPVREEYDHNKTHSARALFRISCAYCLVYDGVTLIWGSVCFCCLGSCTIYSWLVAIRKLHWNLEGFILYIYWMQHFFKS